MSATMKKGTTCWTLGVDWEEGGHGELLGRRAIRIPRGMGWRKGSSGRRRSFTQSSQRAQRTQRRVTQDPQAKAASGAGGGEEGKSKPAPLNAKGAAPGGGTQDPRAKAASGAGEDKPKSRQDALRGSGQAGATGASPRAQTGASVPQEPNSAAHELNYGESGGRKERWEVVW